MSEIAGGIRLGGIESVKKMKGQRRHLVGAILIAERIKILSLGIADSADMEGHGAPCPCRISTQAGETNRTLNIRK